MHHFSHTQVTALAVAVVLAFALWTWFWAWIWWMALRVLRWTYLEKKQDWTGSVPDRVETWHAGGSDAGVGRGPVVPSGPGWER